MRISVVGSGAWGTALSLLLLENGHKVTLWSYFDKERETMATARENPYLKGVALPPELELTSDLSCVRDSGVVVLATPSYAVRETASRLKPLISPDAVVVSVSKGIEKDTSLCMTEIIRQEIGDVCPIVALSGPSHAEEVGRRVPTAVVAACEDISVAEKIQELFMSERFRVYTTDDIIGVELGAALKNVIALCAGICDGMGFGDNTKAMLMTRGLAEIARIGFKMGGRKETFGGLAGMGDLIVTCTSMHSRNRRAGILIGKGKTAREAMDEVGAVVEGYYAAASGNELAHRCNTEVPITQAVYRVMYENVPLQETFRELMKRPGKSEKEEGWI